MGVILTMTMVLFTAVAIVRERERGNLELLINTPVRTPELMVGKILPYMAIGMVQVTLILLVGRFLFEVPIRGSLVDVYVAGLVFVDRLARAGPAHLHRSPPPRCRRSSSPSSPSCRRSCCRASCSRSTACRSPRSGIAEVLPLTHFVRIIRGILLRGATLGEVRAEIWPLLAFLAVAMTLAIARFRKRLD